MATQSNTVGLGEDLKSSKPERNSSSGNKSGAATALASGACNWHARQSLLRFAVNRETQVPVKCPICRRIHHEFTSLRYSYIFNKIIIE
jgi:hypothetical protein